MDLVITFNRYAAKHLGLTGPSNTNSYLVCQNILPILHYLNNEWRKTHPNDDLIRVANGQDIEGFRGGYQISLTLHPDYAKTFMVPSFRDIAPERVAQKMASCLAANLKTQLTYTRGVQAPALFGIEITCPTI